MAEFTNKNSEKERINEIAEIFANALVRIRSTPSKINENYRSILVDSFDKRSVYD
jgi:hypothetical protein